MRPNTQKWLQRLMWLVFAICCGYYIWNWREVWDYRGALLLRGAIWGLVYLCFRYIRSGDTGQSKWMTVMNLDKDTANKLQ